MNTNKCIALGLGAIVLVATGCSSANVAATVDESEIEDATVLALRVDNEGEVTVAGDRFRDDLSRLIFTEALLIAAEEDFGLVSLDAPETRDAYLASVGPREQELLDSIATDSSLSDEALKLTVTQLVLLNAIRDVIPDDWTTWLDDVVEQADIAVRSDIGTWFSPADGIVPPPRSP